MSKNRRMKSQDIREPTQTMGEAQRRIGDYLRKVRFKRALFGVSERDVWRKLEAVNDLFQQALVAERARYEALLEFRDDSSSQEGNGGEKVNE